MVVGIGLDPTFMRDINNLVLILEVDGVNLESKLELVFNPKISSLEDWVIIIIQEKGVSLVSKNDLGFAKNMRCFLVGDSFLLVFLAVENINLTFWREEKWVR